VTRLLRQLDGPTGPAVNALIPIVYDELRRLAAARLRGERPDHTLNATALVHEAWLRLVDQTQVEWQNRAHFFAVAARVIRQVLINYAEAHHAAKRGGGALHITLTDAALEAAPRPDRFLALDEALARLEQHDQRKARIIEYVFFVGLSHHEIAEVLGISEPTVRRDLRLARAWLAHELGDP
jgi:RNA polymerase sigma factor (TIGR02999 family)